MKIIISLILVCYSTLAFSFGFRFAFLQKYGIKLNSTYRTYGDGRFAKSCNEYINANGRYSYTGDVGDGIYRIQPDAGSAFDVFCDMTTNGGGWTMVLNLEAVSDTYGWSNSFWTDSSTLNTTTFNSSTTQSKYQSFNNVAGTNIMWRSKQGSTGYTVYNGAIGSLKTMFQIMQSPVNTTIGTVGINMQLNSTFYPTYGVNYYRIGPASGNVYHSNIGWGSAQVSVQNPPAGCPQHSGGNWGINSYTCTACNITNSMSDSCGGQQALWNSQVFIK